MYGDFSRLAFIPDQYTAVLSQQGRVQLDSDANELTSILLNHIRTLTVDLIGPFGTGYPGNGFKVQAIADDPDDLLITPGHYYVHGLRCTLSRTHPAGTGAVRYSHLAGAEGVPTLPPPPYVVELVAWEESVSAVQEPSLLEPALGPNPPDTTARLRVRFRVNIRATRPDGKTALTGKESAQELRELYLAANTADAHRPALRARVRTSDPDPDTAQLAVAAGYSRAENQLYRIEIHTGGRAGKATFKWSRNNGSDEYSVTDVRSGGGEQTIAELAERARDAHDELARGDWVEACDASWLPDDAPVPLQQVVGYDREHGLATLVGPSDFALERRTDFSGSFLRRWDQRDDVRTPDNGVPIPDEDDGWYELEDGVQVQFASPDAHYRTGDYWLVPARTGTGGVLWPRDPHSHDPQPVPASRPPRYRAPLAMVVNDDHHVRDTRVQLSYTHHDTAGDADSTSSGSNAATSQGASAEDDREPVSADAVDAAEAPADGTQHIPIVATPHVAPTAQPSPVLLQLTVLPFEGNPPAKSKVEIGHRFPRSAGQASIGRWPPNDIALDDPTVSRGHAAISVEPRRIMLQETGTRHPDGTVTAPTNGTYVNEKKITTATRLRDGDVIRVGAVRLGVNFLDQDLASANGDD